MNSKGKKSLPPTPHSFKEVKALSYQQLMGFCKEASVKTQNIGRDSLEILLCDTLGITTTGSKKEGREEAKPKLSDHCLDKLELREFEKLTPAYIQALNGWTKNTSDIPELDVGTVKKYLLASDNPEFTKASLKRYKLSRSYGHLNAKHINNLAFHPMPDSNTFCVVKAQCLPSQSTETRRVKWLHVIIDKSTGDPYGAFCVCTVGRGQACSHVGALLFLLSELVADGVDSLPEDQSCTDVLCEWTKAKGAHVTPTIVEDITIREGESRSRPSVSNYAPQVAPTLTPEEDYQRVLKLIFDVRNANKRSAMPPVVNIIDTKRFKTTEQPEPQVQSCLPNQCLDHDIAISSEVCVTSYPLPLYRFPHAILNSVNDSNYNIEKQKFIDSISYSLNEIDEIERLTKDQSSSEIWFDHRKGAITGSKVARIFKFMNNRKANPDNIVSDIMQYKLNKELSKKVPALAWGLKKEETALQQYKRDFSKTHKNVELIKPGLLVHQDSPFIRVSPDAIMTCSCHGNKLVEVKCPYKYRNENPQELLESKKLDYVERDGENFVVKKGSPRGYLEQITLQQAISYEDSAELLIWTKKGYAVIQVNYDKDYWETELYPSMTTFFTDFIVREILTERIKNRMQKSIENVVISDVSDESESESLISSETTPSEEPLSQSDIAEEALSQSDIAEEGLSQSDIAEEALSQSDTDSIVSTQTVVNDFFLGCSSYCKDNRAPSFSRVKGKLIMCDANLVCGPNTQYHFFCEGFRRKPDTLKTKYACKKCREMHPDKEILYLENGFYE